MDNNNLEWLKQIPINIGWYLSGFADGEGSFNVSLRKNYGYRVEWQVVLTFNVAQRDVTNLILFKKHLGCGRLQSRPDGVHYFVVNNYHSIIDRILPFFEKFYFFSSSKKTNFSIFKQITLLMKENEHCNPEGLQKIISLREKLNEGRGRRRKYNQKDIKINYQKFLRDYTPDPNLKSGMI